MSKPQISVKFTQDKDFRTLTNEIEYDCHFMLEYDGSDYINTGYGQWTCQFWDGCNVVRPTCAQALQDAYELYIQKLYEDYGIDRTNHFTFIAPSTRK